MDFSVDGSDSWDSTPAQDKFIQNYFREKEPQSGTVTKAPKKRKKQSLNADIPSTTIISKKNSSVAAKSSKDLETVKMDAVCSNGETESLVKKTKKRDYPKVVEPDNFKKTKKSNKRSLKVVPNDFTVTNVSDFKESSCQNDKNPLKKTNVKKNKSSSGQTQNKLSEIKADSKIKRIKDTKETLIPKVMTSISDESGDSEDDESGDSEDDEAIRNELQNTLMFKKIQKLMKMAPRLNPNFKEDIEGNNSSCEEVSAEEWSDIDEDLSGSEVEESKDDLKNSSDDEDLPHKKANQSDSLQVKKKLKKSYDNDIQEDLKKANQSDPLQVKKKLKKSNDNDIQESYSTSKEIMETSSNQQSSNLISPLINRNPSQLRANENAKRSSCFMEKTRAKLAAAKFRFLNEKLYTESGGEAFEYFQENREEFEDYHLGYGMQVSKWPLNPVNEIIADLQKSKKDVVIADMGCGDAKIARVLTNKKVHSFDLVAMHECVTACNFSRVPLPDSNVDVVVFCLSLMGTNLVDYLQEAYRILKIGGSLKIAEVESRIENLDLFIKNLNSMGFSLEKQNTKNKLFVFLDLKKVKKGKASKAPAITLRPCLYKKR